MKAFLTGASGFVGGHLLQALVDAGAQVRCLVRPSSPRSNLERLPCDLIEGDLGDPEAIRRALEGRDAVFHCAADYRLYVPDPDEMYAANVGGTQNVLAAAAAAGVGRIVYTSTVGALGLDPAGKPADEATSVKLSHMVGHYKRTKFLAERAAVEWAAKGLPVVIVNPSTPVGERDLKPTPTGQMIVDFLNRRTPAYVDTGLNLVDVRDVAAGHLLAAERGKIGERYILGNRNLTLREIFATLSEISGLPAPRVRIPHAVAFGFAALETAVARCRGRAPRVPLDSVRLSRHRMFFDPRKAVAELGLPQTPVERALERAVAWFREAGYARA